MVFDERVGLTGKFQHMDTLRFPPSIFLSFFNGISAKFRAFEGGVRNVSPLRNKIVIRIK